MLLPGLLLAALSAGAQSVPARPSALDRRLKAAYVAFLKSKAAANAAAREISAFYAGHPGLDMRFPDAAQFQSAYAGPATPPFELIRAYYDPRLEVIVVPRTGELAAVTEDAFPEGRELSKLLRVRANDILHESFHAMLDKTFGFKVVNVFEGELLANWKEAQYLSKELALTPELKKAAEEHFRLEALRRQRGPDDPGVRDLEADEAKAAQALGPDDVDDAVKVVRLLHGPAFFKRSIEELYGAAGQGQPSAFLPSTVVAERLRQELSRTDLKPQEREILLVEDSFWSRPSRVERVRRYFRGAIPELTK